MQFVDTHVRVSSFVGARARESHVFVTSFMNDETADWNTSGKMQPKLFHGTNCGWTRGRSRRGLGRSYLDIGILAFQSPWNKSFRREINFSIERSIVLCCSSCCCCCCCSCSCCSCCCSCYFWLTKHLTTICSTTDRRVSCCMGKRVRGLYVRSIETASISFGGLSKAKCEPALLSVRFYYVSPLNKKVPV